MKLTVIAVLSATLCSPVLASEPMAAPPAEPNTTATTAPDAVPVTASPVFAEMPPAPEATPVPPARVVAPRLIVPPASTFCGQAQVYWLLSKTEMGEQRYLRQQAQLEQLLLKYGLQKSAATPTPLVVPAPVVVPAPETNTSQQ